MHNIRRPNHCVGSLCARSNLSISHSYFNSFGGTDGKYHYNDTWSFSLSTRKWTELQCIGFIPSAREGHAAAVVGNVIYIFGGRGVDGQDLGDLAAFKISSWSHVKFVRKSFRLYLIYRSTVVYVSKHGSFTQRSVWTCYGVYRDENLCFGWRIILTG